MRLICVFIILTISFIFYNKKMNDYYPKTATNLLTESFQFQSFHSCSDVMAFKLILVFFTIIYVVTCQRGGGGGGGRPGGKGGGGNNTPSPTPSPTTPSPTAPTTPTTAAPTNCPRIRKEWNTATQNERDLYINALLELSSQGILQKFTLQHSRPIAESQAHGVGGFLPWHR